ncbi:MAG TPA: peptidylprolyl isomerase [Cellulomonas sp.]|uniref:peptidylprolyl isomerase n=1 Tax=Cellulomonas sp. TaxID=40001 RepID=UPI002E315E9E|nr:peptidylprolyl isomerase [Cellulomonas sp.]HEX5334005.1 peptidylprolyl isomerase [Cellulomonas sp.]
MSSSKREREYERRRYEKWQQRQAEHKARRRRLQVIVGSLLGVLLVTAGVAGAVALTKDKPSAATPIPSSTGSPSASPSSTRALPDKSVAGARTWTGTLTLNSGAVGIELDGAAAPQAVANFVTLAKDGYFNGTVCHRLALGIHVLQCGDPTATGENGSGGTGGPGYAWGPIENAPADGVYKAGTIAMARQSNDGSSMGSQFFLVYQDTTIPSDTAGGYTIFGHITSGLGVVQAIADAGVQGGGTQGAPATRVTIEGVETQ